MLKVMLITVVVVCVLFAAGCQTDFVGPSASMKILYQGENNNQEYLSRGAGMTAGTGYGAGVMSWGLSSNQEDND